MDLVPKQLADLMAECRRTGKSMTVDQKTGKLEDAKDWNPHPYQERGLKMLLEDAQCGLLADPGTGKTSMTLAAIKILLKKKLIRRVLVVAPLRPVYEVWPQEILEWNDFREFNVAILHDGQKDKRLRQLTSAHQIALINPEGLAWLFADKERIKLLDADMLVIDESSRFKNSQSQRFKILKKRLLQFKRRHILTGSPRPRSYDDLFSQIYILDNGAALGSFITHYHMNYFYPTGFEQREWALLPGADKQIDALIAPMVLRVEAEEYLKMPGRPDRFHRVDLPEAARKEYDSIEETMMSALFTAPMVSAGAARSKLCQMANGAVYADAALDSEERWTRERKVKVLHTAKVDALAELVEELQGEPLLCSIGFHHDVEAIRGALGRDVPCLNSKMTRAQSAAIIAAWNQGKLPLLLGHPASMGHGLNLQKCGCRHVSYFDIPDDYDLFDQFYRRVWRQGNKAAFVFKHYFIARATVDEAKMRNLERKGTGQKAFLDAMKAYADAKYGGKVRR